MRQYILFLAVIYSFNSFSLTISGTYSAGIIPTTHNTYSSSCNGEATPLNITLPAGCWQVTGIDIVYQMTGTNDGWMSEQRSRVKCQNTAITESTYSGVGASIGTYSYNRTGVTIANGTFTGGTILVFELQAWRTWEGTSGCNSSINYINNSSWTITVTYSAASSAYTSSTVVDLAASGNSEKCDYNVQMSRVEIVATTGCTAYNLTQLLVNMTGTATTSTVNRVHVYYTGTSSTYAATNEFVSGGKAPSASLTFTGNQALLTGTNYFWIVYDFNNTGTVSNTIGADMPNSSITIGGVAYTPTATPNCLKTYIACAPYPTNATLWLKGNASTNTTTQGAAVSSWGSSGSVALSATQETAANQPTYQEGSGNTSTNKFNYNPYISYDGVNDYLSSTGTYNLGDGNAAGSGFSLFGVLSYTSGIVALDWNGTNGKTKIKVDGIFVINDATTSTGTSNQAYNAPVVNRTDLYSIRGKQSGITGRYNANSLTASSNNNPSITKRITLGANVDFGEIMGGAISEFLIFPSTLSTINNLKVESYLAIKYGVTLGTSTLTSNYLSTSGTTIWTATPSYQNNIIGIGRDDASLLYQKQSHNLDDSIRLYKGNIATTNSGNASTFAVDASYIMMGATMGKLKSTNASVAETPASCNLYSRIAREWKVTKTNMGETVNMQIILSPNGTPTSVVVADLRLLVDDDGDFSNGGTTCYANGDGTGIVFTYSNPMITISGISTTHIANNTTKYITIGSANINTPLPVELIEFNAFANNKRTVDITWTTASEINNDYFKVEKSTDIENWETIATVNGAGNSNSTLHYISEDKNPIFGLNYYRLKQVDFDGVSEYSEIKVVNIESKEDYLIFPNPTTSSFSIRGEDIQNKRVKIMNQVGQEVLIVPLSSQNEIIEFDSSQLSEGIYTIQISGEVETFISKLIVI